MKTKIFIKFALLATIFFAFSFAISSCSDLIGSNSKNDSDEKNLIEISGNFCVNGAVPSEITASFSDDADCNIKAESSSSETESSSINTAETQSKNARTALPSIPASITYKVSATFGSSTVQGEVNGNSFTIKLSSGTWTVTAEGFSDSSMAANTKILEGSTLINLSANPVKNDISITLEPLSSGSGTIDLTVNFESTTGINSVEMILIKVDSNPQTITGYGSTSAQLTSANIPAGVYNAVLNFKSSATPTDTEELKYSAYESVNVLPNFTTDTWQGRSPYFTKTDGKTELKITKALVDNFSRKEFYVQGTSGTYNPPTTANDDNSGTYFDPFATIQQAVDTINAINDGTSAYKIKVDGTIEIPFEINVSAGNNKNLNLTIEGVKANPKATIKQNSSSRVFKVNGSNVNVTMKNLIITGGNDSSGGGGGIRLEAGNLTLSNVEVTGNFTPSIGGGILVRDNATLTLNEGTKISKNKATDDGGGVYLQSGVLNVTNSEISENETYGIGGGGGICIKGGTLKINGTTTMSGNKLQAYNPFSNAKGSGAAIFVGKGTTAELDGSNGTVSITSADSDPLIYLEQGTLGSTSTGGSGGNTLPVKDAVLKLGGNIRIGNRNTIGIKIEDKMDKTNANIMITKKLDSNIINISYDSVFNNESIIRAENATYSPTTSEYSSFTVNGITIAGDGNYYNN